MSAKKTAARKPTTPLAKPAPKRAAGKPQVVGRITSDKLSALDAAAKVLGETRQPMNCKALIEAMAARKYWTSPAGRTPWSTLYAALLKEVTTKGKASRFVKVDRGLFALRGSN